MALAVVSEVCSNDFNLHCCSMNGAVSRFTPGSPTSRIFRIRASGDNLSNVRVISLKEFSGAILSFNRYMGSISRVLRMERSAAYPKSNVGGFLSIMVVVDKLKHDRDKRQEISPRRFGISPQSCRDVRPEPVHRFAKGQPPVVDHDAYQTLPPREWHTTVTKTLPRERQKIQTGQLGLLSI
jgi:hypothetical protein